MPMITWRHICTGCCHTITVCRGRVFCSARLAFTWHLTIYSLVIFGIFLNVGETESNAMNRCWWFTDIGWQVLHSNIYIFVMFDSMLFQGHFQWFHDILSEGMFLNCSAFQSRDLWENLHKVTHILRLGQPDLYDRKNWNKALSLMRDEVIFSIHPFPFQFSPSDHHCYLFCGWTHDPTQLIQKAKQSHCHLWSIVRTGQLVKEHKLNPQLRGSSRTWGPPSTLTQFSSFLTESARE